jgi:NTE family protein
VSSSGKGKTVSLVLGSGGARGMAHIGIIEWLEENEYQIRSIAGCSIGALIGGIYAAGKLDQYRDWVCELDRVDVVRLLDLSFGASGFFKAEKIIRTLKEMVGEYRIEDLPISYTAVATDIEQQKEVWISHGPLFDAIRASIGVPILLTPYEIDGRQLVDGGLLNPVPIAPTLRDRTDMIVAVDLGAKSDPKLERKVRKVALSKEATGSNGKYRQQILEFIEGIQQSFGTREKEELSMFDIVFRSFDTMQNAVARLKLAAYNPDVIISIPRNLAETHEYWRARELIEAGRQRAEDTRALIERQSGNR